MSKHIASQLTVVALTLLGTTPSFPAPNYFWKLGAGLYWSMGSMPDVDEARWDWLEVNYPSPEAIERLNRLQEINPKQKYLMRLWPTNGLGDPKYDLGCACMFDYLYKPGVKEAIHKGLRDQVAVCLKLKRRESLIGFTFLEELPGWWGMGSEVAWSADPNKVPERFEACRAAIEKDRGKPLVMDDDTRLWLGRKYAETLGEIHRTTKQCAPDKMVLYWHHSGFATIDEVAGAPLSSQGLYPFRFSDIVKPGLCDGLMAYPNRPDNFERRYLWFVRKARCPYFTQLSHPSGMRLTNWPDAIAMAKTKDSWNMGYFLFCSGQCNSKQWNDDPDVSPSDNAYLGSCISHIRRIATQQGVGMDIVRSYFHPEVEVDLPLKKMKAGTTAQVTAVVRNPKDPSYYPDPKEAVAREVKATLTLPKGWSVDMRYSVPATVPVGDLAPGESKAVTWYLATGSLAAVTAKTPVKVTATAKDMPIGERSVWEDTEVPGFLPHEILTSGTSWDEPGYRLPADRPYLVLDGLHEPVRNPTLSDGERSLTYKGELCSGLRLVVHPEGAARLFATNLIPPIADLKDPNDPTGHRGWAEGYGISGAYVGKYLRGGLKYRLAVSGKATDGAAPLLIVRCRNAANEVKDFPSWGIQFTDTWKESSSVEVEIPAEVNHLERIYLYRYNNKGVIWYGQPSFCRADIPAEGLDVSGQLSGQPLRLASGSITKIAYTDENPPSPSPRVRVRVAREQP